MDYKNIYGAGFRHGQVKVAAGTVYDIDAIIGIEGEPEQESIQIPGDDTIKATSVQAVLKTSQLQQTQSRLTYLLLSLVTLSRMLCLPTLPPLRLV